MSLTNLKLEAELVEAVKNVYDVQFPEMSIKTPTEAIRQALREFLKEHKKATE